MSNNYGSDSYDKHAEIEPTAEEIEQAYCDELARKMLDHELDAAKFWNLPRK